MKKILAIVLAMVFVLAAVSAMADITIVNNKVEIGAGSGCLLRRVFC